MRLSNVAVAAASFGVAAAGPLKRTSPNTCSNVEFTGEVLHLSVNIIEYPVIVDVEVKENAVVTIDKTVLIDCTNAPTHLHTTVYATTTSTVTKTISTATISATAQPSQHDASGSEGDRTVSIRTGTKTNGSNP